MPKLTKKGDEVLGRAKKKKTKEKKWKWFDFIYLFHLSHMIKKAVLIQMGIQDPCLRVTKVKECRENERKCKKIDWESMSDRERKLKWISESKPENDSINWMIQYIQSLYVTPIASRRSFRSDKLLPASLVAKRREVPGTRRFVMPF